MRRLTVATERIRAGDVLLTFEREGLVGRKVTHVSVRNQVFLTCEGDEAVTLPIGRGALVDRAPRAVTA